MDTTTRNFVIYYLVKCCCHAPMLMTWQWQAKTSPLSEMMLSYKENCWWLLQVPANLIDVHLSMSWQHHFTKRGGFGLPLSWQHHFTKRGGLGLPLFLVKWCCHAPMLMTWQWQAKTYPLSEMMLSCKENCWRLLQVPANLIDVHLFNICAIHTCSGSYFIRNRSVQSFYIFIGRFWLATVMTASFH
jgi:hypothetical protein